MKVNLNSLKPYHPNDSYFRPLDPSDDRLDLRLDYVCRCGCHYLKGNIKKTEHRASPDVVSFSSSLLTSHKAIETEL
ncbi:MAG TPA: hypothetical protein EYO33_23430 [Phycisphaerales bacterium]|nr:hypothetical protein [Phycisphaerales bacterium]